MNELTDLEEALARRVTTAQIVVLERELAEARALLARVHEIANLKATSAYAGFSAANKADLYARLSDVLDLTAPYANPNP